MPGTSILVLGTLRFTICAEFAEFCFDCVLLYSKGYFAAGNLQSREDALMLRLIVLTIKLAILLTSCCVIRAIAAEG
jgi:hypothetical protein